MALLRATTLAIMCFLLACPPRGGGQLLEDGLNVPLLPDGSPAAEPCPQNARDLMRALRLRVGNSAHAEIDANQFERKPLTVFPGPVESMITERLGPIGTASRFYGRIWVTQRGVVIRYYHAAQPDGETFPICAVARRDAGEMMGKPGAYPGSMELESSTMWIFIVEDFR